MMDASELKAKRLVYLAAGSMFLAGILHLAIIPQHWAHAQAHSLFFLVAAVAQISWSLAFWRSRSPFLAEGGFILSLALVVLWGLTRVLLAPFGHGPEEVDPAGIATKACEAICAASLAALLATASFTKPQPLPWLRIISLVLLSIALAAVTYEGGIAAQPFFPSLAPIDEDHQEQPTEEDQHGHSLLPLLNTIDKTNLGSSLESYGAYLAPGRLTLAQD